MQTNAFLLCGANGYTGELIARAAKQYHLQPILAGRRKELIEPLANKLNCATGFLIYMTALHYSPY